VRGDGTAATIGVNDAHAGQGARRARPARARYVYRDKLIVMFIFQHVRDVAFNDIRKSLPKNPPLAEYVYVPQFSVSVPV
jgi:hypothetical protein